MSDHHKVFVAGYLILKRDNEVFLLRRHNTGYQDGNYGLPAGHLEAGEQPTDTAIREAKEESGIDALPENVRCVHVMHRSDHGQNAKDYNDFFFLCEKWQGEPHNAEPEKCDDARWFPLDQLPENTTPYIQAALEHMQNHQFYSER